MPDIHEPAVTAYDADFYAWANAQAALLRAGQWSRLDVEQIAEELEALGRSEKRELVSRLTVLLAHLLKWQFQPSLRSNSWRLSVRNARLKLRKHLEENPSLKSVLNDAIADAYRDAHEQAVKETGLDIDKFPAACPWTYEDFMRDDFWP